MDGVGRISGHMLEANLERQTVELKFKNEDTDVSSLLYLDVTNANLSFHKLGINTDSPSQTLEINGTTNTLSGIVTGITNIARFEFAQNSISDISNYITFSSADAIRIGNKLSTANLTTYSNRIDSTTSIEFNSDVHIYADTNIYGNLYTVGNLTFDGDIIFGNNNLDGVSFSADVASAITPDLNYQYNLGAEFYRWNEIFVTTVTTHELDVTTFVVNNLQPTTRPGNNLFVAKNGSDSNQGNHENGPFATLKHALSVATTGTTVTIYPGTYTEDFPLTVPVGVTVTGVDIRSVKIQPTVSTRTLDAFLLNGECTIENITVQDFFFDAVNNTGYAFRFASNFTVTSRSPYIRNVSVLTKGSITTLTDPNGYLQGDAGKGALIDGSVANSSSNKASVLFHSVTFITPGVDCITMTNGVRVELIDSFTYYANRGLYATTGSLGFASLSTTFGAEVRVIASACVYGNYGAVADGSSTLMHLVNHNFSYIGLGGNPENDPTLALQTHEVVELNSGKIYYTSVDHDGTFRVGDAFVVDSKKGTTNFKNVESITGLNSLYLIDNSNNTTFIDAGRIDTGNLRLIGNTFESTIGDVNLLAYSTQINLQNSATVSIDLTVTGDTYLNGSAIVVGNSNTDTVKFNNYFDQTIQPNTTELYDLGSNPLASGKVWRKLYGGELQLDSINLNSNTIRTNVGNNNLELQANGTGLIRFEQIYFKSNNITTQASNTNIKLYANGVGNIKLNKSTIVHNDLVVTGDLYVHSNTYLGTDSSNSITFNGQVTTNVVPNGTHNFGSPYKNWSTVYTNSLYTTYLNLSSSSISTTIPGINLVLIADGSGLVKIENINFQNNEITASETDQDIEFNPNGTGKVLLQSNTDITGSLTVSSNFRVDGNVVIGNASSDTIEFKSRAISDIIPYQTEYYDLGSDPLASGNVWKKGYFGNIDIDSININNNQIQTTASNTNLVLFAGGTGEVKVENVSFKDNQLVTNISNQNLQINPNGTGIVKFLTSADLTGDLTLTGDMLVKGHVQIGDAITDPVQFVSNVSSSIIPSQTDFYDLGSDPLSGGHVWKRLYAGNINVDSLNLNNNKIYPYVTDTNLELYGKNAGGVLIEQLLVVNNNISSTVGDINLTISPSYQLQINSNGALKVPTGTVADRLTLTQADLRFNTDVSRFEGFGTARRTFGGLFSQDRKTYVTAESIQYASDNVINFVANNISTMRVDPYSVGLNGLLLNNTAFFNNNTIAIQTTNDSLFLTPDGTGKTIFGNTSIKDEVILNESNNVFTMNSTGEGYYIIAGTNGILIPHGDTSTRPADPDVGDIRYNSELGYVEAFDGTQYNSCAGVGESVTQTFIEDLSDVFALILG